MWYYWPKRSLKRGRLAKCGFRWKSLRDVLFSFVFVCLLSPDPPCEIMHTLENLTHSHRPHPQPFRIQAEAAELCFCLNGFYHWPLLNFATHCSEFPVNVMSNSRYWSMNYSRVYDTDSKVAVWVVLIVVIASSEWTTPHSKDIGPWLFFTFCLQYNLCFIKSLCPHRECCKVLSSLRKNFKEANFSCISFGRVPCLYNTCFNYSRASK